MLCPWAFSIRVCDNSGSKFFDPQWDLHKLGWLACRVVKGGEVIYLRPYLDKDPEYYDPEKGEVVYRAYGFMDEGLFDVGDQPIVEWGFLDKANSFTEFPKGDSENYFLPPEYLAPMDLLARKEA